MEFVAPIPVDVPVPGTSSNGGGQKRKTRHINHGLDLGILVRFTGPTLQNLRLQRQLSQEEMAALLSEYLGKEVAQNYVSKVENAKVRISLTRFEAFCHVLQHSPSDVMAEIERMATIASRVKT